MLITTSGIVLRSFGYKESSQIARVLTRQHGKLALLAKGARKPKNKLSGKLQIGNMLEVVYYHKDSRSVQLLKEASYETKTFDIRKSVEKMAIATITLEFVDQLVQEGEVNPDIYHFLVTFLVWLNSTELDPTGIFAYNQIRLAEIMGIGMAMEHSVLEQPILGYLNIDTGAITERPQSEHAFKLTQAQTFYLAQALTSKSKSLLSISFEGNEYQNLIHHLDLYFQFHFDSIRERKSDAVFNQILATRT